jgi:membrane-bound metal-dependent hydrolase YbcI (DUF457 family)
VRGSEHFAIAVATAGTALFVLGGGHVELTASSLAVVSAAGIGSLVPDIDHSKAWISNRIPATLIAFGLVFVLWFEFSRRSVSSASSTGLGAALGAPLLDMARPFLGWAWLALTLGALLLSVAMLVTTLVEHRGPTHSLTVAAALTLVACVGFALAAHPLTLGLWFGWGYLTHLLTDLMTPMGCPALLWPWREGDMVHWRWDAPVSMQPVAPATRGNVSPGGHIPEHTDGRCRVARPEDHLGDLAPSSGQTLEEHRAQRESQAAVHQARPAVALGVEGEARPLASKPAGTAMLPMTATRLCPKCGGALVQRRARRGAHAGNSFLGCANFPRCRYIENLVD